MASMSTAAAKRSMAVLFDADGTLIDTYDIILASMRYAINDVLGRDLSDDALMAGVGTPLRDQMVGRSNRGSPFLPCTRRDEWRYCRPRHQKADSTRCSSRKHPHAQPPRRRMGRLFFLAMCSPLSRRRMF